MEVLTSWFPVFANIDLIKSCGGREGEITEWRLLLSEHFSMRVLEHILKRAVRNAEACSISGLDYMQGYEEGRKKEDEKDSRITIATYQDFRILSLFGRPKWIKLILFKNSTWSFRYSRPHCWEMTPIKAGVRMLTMEQHPRPEEINFCSVIPTSCR